MYPAFFFLKRHKHTQRTHFRHLQSPSICQPRSWCRQSSLRYMYTRYRTQQRAELDRVPFIYALNHTQLCASFYISVYQDEDVRACGQACVCVCQADTHLQQQRTSQRRSWCTEPSLRYMYTRHHTQLSASFYVSISR